MKERELPKQTQISLYAVGMKRGLTLVKLNNIKAALPYLPTKEILQTHWAKEYVRVKREEILNESRKPEERVRARREPLCIGIKSDDFDAILTELRKKCRDFGPDEEVIGCVLSGYSPVCVLCRVEEEPTVNK